MTFLATMGAGAGGVGFLADMGVGAAVGSKKKSWIAWLYWILDIHSYIDRGNFVINLILDSFIGQFVHPGRG